MIWKHLHMLIEAQMELEINVMMQRKVINVICTWKHSKNRVTTCVDLIP